MIENNNYIDLRDFSTFMVLVLFFVFLMGFGLLIYYNLQLKKNVKRLNSMNNLLQASFTSKEFQLKDIHHRIKNNLQLIISLLNIEASKKNDDSIEEYLLKGQSRIHSIAAMHQNLYKTEYYDSIKLQNYIESIVRNLTDIYNNDIKIEINTNDTILEVDKAIPVGIIITELVSNSFKHAFTEKCDASIKIDIKKNQNKYELTLRDNGIGFPEKPTSKVAIGLELVSMMVLQINGHLNRKNQQGAIYNISF